MNTVEPIRDKEIIERAKEIAKGRTFGDRDFLLLFMGINCGQRISDLRMLKKADVMGKYIDKREQKTGKERKIYLNSYVREIIEPLIADLMPEDYLFVSRQRSAVYPARREAALKRNERRPERERKTYRPQAPGVKRPITRERAYQIVNEILRAAGMRGKIGNHTLRKTFGYWHYQQFHDVAFLMDLFGHANQGITFRYIGMEQEWRDKKMRGFKL